MIRGNQSSSSSQDFKAGTLAYEAGELSAARSINTAQIHSHRTREKTSLGPKSFTIFFCKWLIFKVLKHFYVMLRSLTALNNW